MSDAPAFLNKFPAQPVPTPQGQVGPGFVHNGPIDPGTAPQAVTPPEGLPGPIHMQSGWHQGPAVSVSAPSPLTYNGTVRSGSFMDDVRGNEVDQIESDIMAAAQQAESALESAAALAAGDADAAVADAPNVVPKMVAYAGLTALGFVVGRKASPLMPIAAIRDSVPTAGALTGYALASAYYGDNKEKLFNIGLMLVAAIGGAYVADMVYPDAPSSPEM